MACLILSARWKIQTNLSKYVPEVHNTLSKAHNVHVVCRNLQKHDYFHFNWKSATHISSHRLTYFKCFFKMWLFWLPADENQIIGVALICSLTLNSSMVSGSGGSYRRVRQRRSLLKSGVSKGWMWTNVTGCRSNRENVQRIEKCSSLRTCGFTRSGLQLDSELQRPKYNRHSPAARDNLSVSPGPTMLKKTTWTSRALQRGPGELFNAELQSLVHKYGGLCMFWQSNTKNLFVSSNFVIFWETEEFVQEAEMGQLYRNQHNHCGLINFYSLGNRISIKTHL